MFTALQQFQTIKNNCTLTIDKLLKKIPARRGLGTPPTKTVFRGSRACDPSITKSASDRLHGRTWTYNRARWNSTAEL